MEISPRINYTTMVQITLPHLSSGAAGTIDVGQSFWLQVSSPGAITFNKSIVTAGSNSFIREFDPQEEAYFGVQVAQEDGRVW